MDSRTDQLRAIRDAVVAINTPLADERRTKGTHPVIGEGSHYARVMFIGEAPGRNEAASGRPFVGAAGKVLNELLETVGIPREDVYITNIVKDRPPFNRDPEPDEIVAYGPFLDQQIAIIQPRVVVSLGRYAMGYVMGTFGLSDQLKPISALHGKVFSAKALYGDISVVPLYHPAVAIYNRSSLDGLKQDFAVLKQFDCSPQVAEE